MTRYVIRLDDAHERHHAARWNAVERLLDEHQIRPIVAVIPDNRDQTILYSRVADIGFWDRVRAWQEKGWTIGVHGLHHDLRPIAHGSLLPMSAHSEFTGLSEARQSEMILTALKVFGRHGIVPKVFVAPAHGFDANTLAVLRRLRQSLILSDGFGIRPFVRRQLAVLPQQLWRGRALPFGTWTICLHPSNMDDKDLHALDNFLARHKGECVSQPHLLRFASYGPQDFLVEQLLRAVFLSRRFLRRVRRARTAVSEGGSRP